MTQPADLPLSVLDLSPVPQGTSVSKALANTLDLARHAESLGFHRFWLAEHHNMPGIASAATTVVIGHVAAGTSKIRVGSGGIMLPNHAPLMVAEAFGTLAALHPGRIDLGLGRAPGTDQATMRALRRYMGGVDRFAEDVVELQQWFKPASEDQSVRAVPGEGQDVPMWLLGSSTYGAQLAAALGLPYAFAAHFAPDQLMEAIEVYRRGFRPSEQLDKPYFMICIGVCAADTDDEARRLFTSTQQQFLALRRGRPGLLPPPVDDITAIAAPHELAGLDHTFGYSAIGSPETVAAKVKAVIAATGADEVMAASQIFDHAARLRSYEILAGLRGELRQAA
ncbi:LLM class flavin-dependent oxidoreductase [Caulobacter sp. D4A]|uniref:LLM class flavin-dependent oxidoreductase n=1 Tax=unclassified Caulobacter TaxID=2648921 RepID=UPI000D740063|nr:MULTISPECIES: LLM class flavin-dependent oxidoreductase [unclassified Caulobacter]PXA85432.1 LLM class flavin-dependent oxidoreductase [Caulobacter sp. D5]PXA95141.1 LLM class flavin-dependent oxidoreductase [Caulobacter sp. D4A]